MKTSLTSKAKITTIPTRYGSVIRCESECKQGNYIQSPIRSGDTVYIKAGVTYGELHGYEVTIIDSTSGFIVYDDAQHVHADKFDINDKWVCVTAQPLGLKLMIIANINHNGFIGQKEIILQVNP